MCPQVEQRFRVFISPNDPIVESEDCLYLNVFVPVDVSIESSGELLSFIIRLPFDDLETDHKHKL